MQQAPALYMLFVLENVKQEFREQNSSTLRGQRQDLKCKICTKKNTTLSLSSSYSSGFEVPLIIACCTPQNQTTPHSQTSLQEMTLNVTPPHFTTVEKILTRREERDTSWGHAGQRANRNRCDSEKASEAFWDIFGCSNTDWETQVVFWTRVRAKSQLPGWMNISLFISGLLTYCLPLMQHQTGPLCFLYFKVLLRSAFREPDQTYSYFSHEEIPIKMFFSPYRSEEGQQGRTNQTHCARWHETHGLRLGVDEPSRVVKMMVNSSREEALNMMPVELESNWSPK